MIYSFYYTDKMIIILTRWLFDNWLIQIHSTAAKYFKSKLWNKILEPNNPFCIYKKPGKALINNLSEVQIL